MAAALEELKPGAYVQQAAYEAALRKHRGELLDSAVVTDLIKELREHRRVLTNIGGNLNDVAKAANSTGEIGNAAGVETILRLVRNVIRSSDALITRIRADLLP